MSNFWRIVDLSLINCGTELDLWWSKECVIFEKSIAPRVVGDPDANPSVQEMAAIQTTGAIFQLNNAKLFVPVVTLSINDKFKFLKNIKQGLRKIFFSNKYRPEITMQSKNNS